MIDADFEIMLSTFGNAVFSETHYLLQAEIIRRIMKCRALTDIERMNLIKQYTSDAGTNGSIYGKFLELRKAGVKHG